MQVWKYPSNRQPWVVTTQIDNPGLTIRWVFPYVHVNIQARHKVQYLGVLKQIINILFGLYIESSCLGLLNNQKLFYIPGTGYYHNSGFCKPGDFLAILVTVSFWHVFSFSILFWKIKFPRQLVIAYFMRSISSLL